MTADPELRFCGVRGSIPTPVRENLGIGGNTTCLELRSPGLPPIIFDGGTGIQALGWRLLSEFPRGGECHIFFTHFHWDHVQGLPFFAPLYRPDWTIHLHSALEPADLEAVLAAQMHAPFFPVEFAGTLSRRCFFKLPPRGVDLDGLEIEQFPLRHPNGVCGYRLRLADASIVFATDHEHGDRALDERLASMAAGASVLIYDAQYTPAEYETRHGWGHSTAEEGARIAEAARVKQLLLFHHDPLHSDEAVGEIVENARRLFPNTAAAAEGLTLQLHRTVTEPRRDFARTEL